VWSHLCEGIGLTKVELVVHTLYPSERVVRAASCEDHAVVEALGDEPSDVCVVRLQLVRDVAAFNEGPAPNDFELQRISMASLHHDYGASHLLQDPVLKDACDVLVDGLV
jgi:hypothetical protein